VYICRNTILYTKFTLYSYPRGTAPLIVNLSTRWGEWSASQPGYITPGYRAADTHSRGWVGTRLDLDVTKTKICCPARKWTLVRPIQSLFTTQTTLSQLSGCDLNPHLQFFFTRVNVNFLSVGPYFNTSALTPRYWPTRKVRQTTGTSTAMTAGTYIQCTQNWRRSYFFWAHT
jgi:hypothetical protein